MREGEEGMLLGGRGGGSKDNSTPRARTGSGGGSG